MAKQQKEGSAKETKEQEGKTIFRELAEVIFYAVSILIFVNGYVWQNFQIPTESMENSLLIGDHLTVNTFVFNGMSEWEKNILPQRDVRRGDVVVFKFPRDIRQDFIKRCVGMPGDRLEIIDDQVYINDKPLDEQYTYYKSTLTQRDPENAYRPVGYDVLKPGIEFQDIPFFNRRNHDANMRAIRYQTIRSLRTMKKTDPELHDRILKRWRLPQ